MKTTLQPAYVKHFLNKLDNFKLVKPKYNQNRILGAMVYLKDESESAYMAQKKGLYVIRATGNSSSIINDSSFVPKIW